MQGLIGFGYGGYANFLSRYFAVYPSEPKIWAMYFCDFSYGQIWIGGYDDLTFSGPLTYIPMLDEGGGGYLVDLQGVYLGSQFMGAVHLNVRALSNMRISQIIVLSRP